MHVQTYRLGLIIEGGPKLSEELAQFTEGGGGVGSLHLLSLLGGEQDVRRCGTLHLRLVIGLLTLGRGSGSFLDGTGRSRHFLN